MRLFAVLLGLTYYRRMLPQQLLYLVQMTQHDDVTDLVGHVHLRQHVQQFVIKLLDILVVTLYVAHHVVKYLAPAGDVIHDRYHMISRQVDEYIYIAQHVHHYVQIDETRPLRLFHIHIYHVVVVRVIDVYVCQLGELIIALHESRHVPNIESRNMVQHLGHEVCIKFVLIIYYHVVRFREIPEVWQNGELQGSHNIRVSVSCYSHRGAYCSS